MARALLAEDDATQGCEYHRPLKVNGCRACDALAEDGAEREFTEAEKQAWIDRGLV